MQILMMMVMAGQIMMNSFVVQMNLMLMMYQMIRMVMEFVIQKMMIVPDSESLLMWLVIH